MDMYEIILNSKYCDDSVSLDNGSMGTNPVFVQADSMSVGGDRWVKFYVMKTSDNSTKSQLVYTVLDEYVASVRNLGVAAPASQSPPNADALKSSNPEFSCVMRLDQGNTENVAAIRFRDGDNITILSPFDWQLLGKPTSLAVTMRHLTIAQDSVPLPNADAQELEKLEKDEDRMKKLFEGRKFNIIREVHLPDGETFETPFGTKEQHGYLIEEQDTDPPSRVTFVRYGVSADILRRIANKYGAVDRSQLRWKIPDNAEYDLEHEPPIGTILRLTYVGERPGNVTNDVVIHVEKGWLRVADGYVGKWNYAFDMIQTAAQVEIAEFQTVR